MTHAKKLIIIKTLAKVSVFTRYPSLLSSRGRFWAEESAVSFRRAKQIPRPRCKALGRERRARRELGMTPRRRKPAPQLTPRLRTGKRVCPTETPPQYLAPLNPPPPHTPPPPHHPPFL